MAVVGDRLSTDILAANELGALSVHTRPLDTKGDNPAALLSRFLENRLLLPLLRRLGRGASYPPGRRGPRAHAAGDGPAAFFAVMSLVGRLCVF